MSGGKCGSVGLDWVLTFQRSLIGGFISCVVSIVLMFVFDRW